MNRHYADDQVTLYHGDALEVLRTLPAASVNCVVTSPPYYGLRDYGVPGQYGLEETPAAYVETMRAVFNEARRVLAADGTLWLNLGDSYSQGGQGGNRGGQLGGGAHLDRVPAPTRAPGFAPKNLLGIPWRVAFALQGDGWTLRSDVIWAKTNCMPESIIDRPSKTHEHVFLFSPGPRYWFDLDAIREPHAQASIESAARSTRQYQAPGQKVHSKTTRIGERGANPGDVWNLPTQPFAAAHFAVMPPALAERCVLAGCRPGGVVLDPFAGSGTTGMVALKHGRRFVGVDLSATYLDLALQTRLAQSALIEPAS